MPTNDEVLEMFKAAIEVALALGITPVELQVALEACHGKQGQRVLATLLKERAEAENHRVH